MPARSIFRRPEWPRRLASDENGISVVEFALISPVFFTLLLGTLDMGHTLYMQSVLQGVLQKAARDSTLESASAAAQQTIINAEVDQQVKRLAANADIEITRRYFRDFTTASQAKAETFTDANSNGTCDNGEAYEDANNNSVWDADGGNAGQGGAKDSVVLTAKVSYPRMFPLHGLIGLPTTTTIQAMTVLANQPYGEQAQYAPPVTRSCT